MYVGDGTAQHVDVVDHKYTTRGTPGSAVRAEPDSNENAADDKPEQRRGSTTAHATDDRSDAITAVISTHESRKPPGDAKYDGPKSDE